MADGAPPRFGEEFRQRIFALAILVLVPLNFAVLQLYVGGLTPEHTVSIIDQFLENPRRAVETDLERMRTQMPALTALPLPFEWAPAEEAKGCTRPPPPNDGEAPRSVGAILADDLQARLGLAVPAALLVVLALPTVGLSLWALSALGPPGWLWAGVAVGAVTAAFGYAFDDSNPLRLLTAEYLLGRAALDPCYAFLTPEIWSTAFWISDMTTMITVGAAFTLVVLFARLAMRPAAAALNEADVLRRAQFFRAALLVASLILVLGVAATHGMMHWSSSLLAPEPRTIVGEIASSAAFYWGIIHSTTLLLVVVPGVLALRLDLAALAANAGQPVETLVDKAGLNVNLRQSSSAILAMAGPMLTGPALDLFTRLTSG